MALNMRNVKTSAPVAARAGRKALVCKAASAPVSQCPIYSFDTFIHRRKKLGGGFRDTEGPRGAMFACFFFIAVLCLPSIRYASWIFSFGALHLYFFISSLLRSLFMSDIAFFFFHIYEAGRDADSILRIGVAS